MLFGSSSKTSNKTTNETFNSDERIAVAENASVIRADGAGAVNITDGGAFDLVGDLGSDAFDAVQTLGELAAELSMGSLDFAEQNALATQAAFAQAARGDGAQFFDTLTRYAVPAAVLIALIWSFRK